MHVFLYLLAVIGTVLASVAGVAVLATVLAVGATVLVFRDELKPIWDRISSILTDTWRTEP